MKRPNILDTQHPSYGLMNEPMAGLIHLRNEHLSKL